MEDTIKSAAKHSLESLDYIDDVLEEFFESLPNRSTEVKRRCQQVLKKIRARLTESLEDADTLTDEAQLQAHLGLMEVQDLLNASRPVIEHFIGQAMKQGQQALDEAQLKGHLALMEAEDYWERDGKKLAKQFTDSSDDMLTMAASTIDDVQNSLSSWSRSLRDYHDK